MCIKRFCLKNISQGVIGHLKSPYGLLTCMHRYTHVCTYMHSTCTHTQQTHTSSLFYSVPLEATYEPIPNALNPFFQALWLSISCQKGSCTLGVSEDAQLWPYLFYTESLWGVDNAVRIEDTDDISQISRKEISYCMGVQAMGAQKCKKLGLGRIIRRS